MEISEAYKFCPRCGAKFEPQKAYLHCPACGLDYYFNPKPCTAVLLINKKSEYLLVKRAFDPGKGLWDLPGGFVEENETFEDNARRELKEELGLELGQLHYVSSHTEPYKFQEIIYPTLAVCFVGKFPEGSRPKPADDVADYAFFRPDNLPTDKFAFGSMSQDFADAARFLSSHKL